MEVEHRQIREKKLFKTYEQQNLSIDFSILTQAFRIQYYDKVIQVQPLEWYQDTRINP